MWLFDLLQKSIPHFTTGSDGREPVDVARIRDIRVRLLKQITTHPDEIARTGDDGLVDALCVLRLELDALPEEHALRTDGESPQVIATVYTELDRLLGTDLPFSEARTLDSALQRLSELASAHSRKRERRKRITRSLTLIVAVVPMLGYGMHWMLGNFYQQAIIDDVDIVYPQNAFEFTKDRYRLRDELRTDSLTAFREYYFRDTVFLLGQRNPLPLAFRAASAADLGVELPPDVKAAIEGGAISELDVETNLFVFRAFIRNVRDSNIVNHLRLRAERIEHGAFPWRTLDLDTEIRFANASEDFAGNLSVAVHTTRTPVLNMNLGMRLQSAGGDVGPVVNEHIDVLTSSDRVTPEFSTGLLASAAGQPMLVRLSPARTDSVSLDQTHRRTLEQAFREFKRTNTLVPENGYMYFACPGGGIAVLGDPQTMQQVLGLETVNAINIDYNYERLDGAKRSGQDRLALEQPALILEDGMSTQPEELEACVQELVAYLTMPSLMPAAGPGGWLSELDKFALMLADRPALKAPVIAAQETLLLDFRNELQELEHGSNQIHILKDGEYVLFTVAATNFQGGNYRFEFFFDEEPVAQFETVLEWPESLRFKKDDVALFRTVPDAEGSD